MSTRERMGMYGAKGSLLRAMILEDKAKEMQYSVDLP